ncbi:MAG: hypothetical protein QM492_09705 [Rhodobacterales bacterium]
MISIISKLSFFGGLLFCSTAFGQSCNVSLEKKAVIESILCGQRAPENVYHFYGEGCFEKSVVRRLEDTVAQILVLDACGYDEKAKELEDANVRAMSFMSDISNCIDQNVDMELAMKKARLNVSQKAGLPACTTSLRRKIKQRLPAFQQMIDQAFDPNTKIRIFEALQLNVDTTGNITDY